jgi:hypothetical protein
MSYWDERDARRDGARDFERRGHYDRERYNGYDYESRAYRQAYDYAKGERDLGVRLAEERHEHSREEARRADLAMEHYREQQDQEPEPESEEIEPLVEAAEQARTAFYNAQAEMWP